MAAALEKAIYAQGLDHDKHTGMVVGVVDTLLVVVLVLAYLSNELVAELPISAEVAGLAAAVDHCNEPTKDFSAN